jgi:hypothetical protein
VEAEILEQESLEFQETAEAVQEAPAEASAAAREDAARAQAATARRRRQAAAQAPRVGKALKPARRRASTKRKG